MDLQALDVLIIGLASWRMASLLVQEDGPALIFDKIRTLVGANKPGQVSGFLPTIFSCLWCMSVWTTIGAYFLFIFSPTITIVIAAMTIALMANFFAKPD